VLVEGVGVQLQRIIKRPLASEEIARLVKIRGAQFTYDRDAQLFLLGVGCGAESGFDRRAAPKHDAVEGGKAARPCRLPCGAWSPGDGPFWKLAQALFEILPRDLEDWKLVSDLLGERETLRTEGKRESFRDTQRQLDL